MFSPLPIPHLQLPGVSMIHRCANIGVVDELSSADVLVIQDLGPWNAYPTITYSAEQVVAFLAEAKLLRGRRVEYIDSEGAWGELLIRDEKFVGFGAANSRVVSP